MNMPTGTSSSGGSCAASANGMPRRRLTPSEQAEIGRRGVEMLRREIALRQAPRWLREALEATQPPPRWRLQFREISSATDTRTSIVAILPTETAAGGSAAGMRLSLLPEVRLAVTRERLQREARPVADVNQARMV